MPESKPNPTPEEKKPDVSAKAPVTPPTNEQKSPAAQVPQAANIAAPAETKANDPPKKPPKVPPAPSTTPSSPPSKAPQKEVIPLTKQPEDKGKSDIEPKVQAAALRNEDLYAFVHLVRQSGHSSWMYLQNIYPAGSIMKQEVALALALCDTLLQGRGAYRVHGGGFAGTVQAFVPFDILPQFKSEIENVLGEGKCHVLNIRSDGGIRVS